MREGILVCILSFVSVLTGIVLGALAAEDSGYVSTSEGAHAIEMCSTNLGVDKIKADGTAYCNNGAVFQYTVEE